MGFGPPVDLGFGEHSVTPLTPSLCVWSWVPGAVWCRHQVLKSLHFTAVKIKRDKLNYVKECFSFRLCGFNFSRMLSNADSTQHDVLQFQPSLLRDEQWAADADFNVRGGGWSFPDALTQLALTDIGGPSRALHKHGVLTNFLQRREEHSVETRWCDTANCFVAESASWL